MGIDARLLIRYRGERPTEDQLARWSFGLMSSFGTKKLFVTDGLPREAYEKADAAWHAAFEAHPMHAEWKRLSEPLPGDSWLKSDRTDARFRVGTAIRAEVGEAPKKLRRAIDLTEAYEYGEDDTETKLEDGKAYNQDGDTIYAADGEWLMQVSLWTRYYGPSYERGDCLTICGIAEWCDVNIPSCEVWYGGDSSGVCAEPFGAKERAALKAHFYGPDGQAYFQDNRDAPRVCPPACGLCIPGEPRFTQCMWGPEKTFGVACHGCHKQFDTRDDGRTWTERKES